MKNFENTLIVSSYAPSGIAGAPIICRQLFQSFDMSALSIICEANWHDVARKTCPTSLLPCEHILIKEWWGLDLRPRRIFAKLRDSINALRVSHIANVVIEACKKRRIKQIFAPLYSAEFGIAAYRAHRKMGIPLYLFESDSWPMMTKNMGLGYWMVRQYHQAILKSARRVWLTSPAMVSNHQHRYNISGRFLFHYLEEKIFESSTANPFCNQDGCIQIVYTGAVNEMHADSFQFIANEINRGIVIQGRQVKLKIFSSCDVKKYLGSHVTHEGFVPYDQIPKILSSADLLLVCVSFLEDRRVRELVSTSLFTKTVDYLAVRRPVIIFGPRHSAQVDYFGHVTEVVDQRNRKSLERAFHRLVTDKSYTDALVEKGFTFALENHSSEVKEREFLQYFREANSCEVS